MSDQPKIHIPKELTEEGLLTQTEMLPLHRRQNSMLIGIPRETTLEENRVALVPSAVASLIRHGHRVIVETGAGLGAHYTDHRFSEAGADIAYSPEQVYKSDILVKIAPPTLAEVELMRPNQIIFSPLQLPIITGEFIERLQFKRVIGLAMEYLRDHNGTFPVVRTMSEIAGMSVMLTAAELMTSASGGKGVLLGGIAGVPPAKVVILGAGGVAESATRVALGLGAEVRVFDNNVGKLMRLQNLVGRRLNTSTMNPQQLEKELLIADVAIGAIHSPTGRTPMIINEDIVSQMKPGAVIMDVSIDQGGVFATSEVTTHSKPTFVKHGVIHYCVPNIASKIARTASIAMSNIITPILLNAGQNGFDRLLHEESGIRNGVYVFKGVLTNEYLGRRFNLKATNLDLLITSGF